MLGKLLNLSERQSPHLEMIIIPTHHEAVQFCLHALNALMCVMTLE